MNVVSVTGFLSTCAFLIPVFLILFYRLFVNKSLMALLLYYLLTALHNFMTLQVVTVPKEVARAIGVAINYLDAPLMFTVLLFFCTANWQRKGLLLSICIFIVYELVVSGFYGFTSTSLVYIMGPAILILSLYAGYFFTRAVKVSIQKNKAFGKTFMIMSILFAYGCYAMVYCFYYLQRSPAVADVFLIYYISSLLASCLMGLGLYRYNQRFAQIKEVQVMRRELRVIFHS
jgi:hypothetical protein